jgi:hypothetical protein
MNSRDFVNFRKFSPACWRARGARVRALPGPIVYYGDSYGGIRTRTKYNTTLVTRGGFSTSSAAAPKQNWAQWRFRSFIFGLICIGGRVLSRKFDKFYNWAKPSPRFNPPTMHRTITGILRKIREFEASSMGVEMLRGYNLYRSPGCNPKTSDHKHASIFAELAVVLSRHTTQADTKFSTKFSM